MKKIIAIIAIILLVTGCSKNDFAKEYEKVNNTVNEKNNKPYRNVNIKDNNIKKITLTEAVNVIKNEKAVIYFGFDTCPWCRSMVENFVDVTNNLKIENVYYVDIKETRDVYEVKDKKLIKTKEAAAGYDEVVELLKENLSIYSLKDENGNEFPNDLKRIYAPNVVVVNSGKVLGLTVGYPVSLTDPYGEITEEMKKESYQSLYNLISKLNNGVCTQGGC